MINYHYYYIRMNNTAVSTVTQEMMPSVLICLFWFIAVTTYPILVTITLAYGYWQAHLQRIIAEDDEQKLIDEFFLMGGLMSSILLIGAHLRI